MNSFLRSLLVFAFFLTLLIVGLRYGLREVTPTRTRRDAAPEPAEWAAWKEQRFEDLGFSLRYPPEYPTIEGGEAPRRTGPFLAVRSRARFAVVIAKTPFKGTNLLDGVVAVVAEEGPAGHGGEDEAPCDLLAPAGSEPRPMLKREDIGGETFAVGGFSGSFGGTLAESLVYHAKVGGRCVEITASLFSTNIRNVDPRKVKQFDRVAAWKALTDVVATFRPLDEASR